MNVRMLTATIENCRECRGTHPERNIYHGGGWRDGAYTFVCPATDTRVLIQARELDVLREPQAGEETLSAARRAHVPDLTETTIRTNSEVVTWRAEITAGDVHSILADRIESLGYPRPIEITYNHHGGAEFDFDPAQHPVGKDEA